MRSLLLVLLLALPAAAEEPAAICFTKDLAYTLAAPEKWVLDSTSGKAQGLCTVFYPAGSSWSEASTVMYANVAAKVDGQQIVRELIDYDVEQFRKKSASLAVIELAPIVVNQVAVPVRKFSGDQHGNVEAIAYIGEEKAFVMLVLSARNANEFLRAYPAFEAMVKSYRFVTSNVTFKE